MQQKLDKNFFVSKIIASKLVSLNCPYEEQDTFYQQPNKADPRFCMSIRETFSNSIALTLTNKYNKRAGMQCSTVLGHVYHVAC